MALACDWQWGDRYFRAGVRGTVLGGDAFGRLLVMLDCFTPDSAPQVIPADELELASPPGAR